MKKLLYIIVTISAIIASSCIDDSFTTSPSDQPIFSVDTLDLGTVFTDEPTVTFRFTVKNPSSKSLSISTISMSGDDAKYFRLNVDGFSGTEFKDVEIRGKDSIFVFVAATLPTVENINEPVVTEAKIDFLTNGVSQSVVVKATGEDAIRLNAVTIEENTVFDAKRPYKVADSLVVAKGTTLTLPAGTRILFHSASFLKVYGTLICEGTPDAYVTLAGDRTGNVVGGISFDLMSQQWRGVFFESGSSNNLMSHTIVKNTDIGVIIDGSEGSYGSTSLKLINSRLRNSAGTSLMALHADINAIGCEFAEAGEGLVYLRGGRHKFSNCTFANYYLFAVIGGPAITFDHVDYQTNDGSYRPLLKADINNCIIYGLGKELSHKDLTGCDVMIRNCLFKSPGTDDDNFLNCIWNEDPLYYTIRNEYYFDYRLHDDSPAIGASDPSLVPAEAEYDGYGLPRGSQPDLGAYVYQPEEKEEQN